MGRARWTSDGATFYVVDGRRSLQRLRRKQLPRTNQLCYANDRYGYPIVRFGWSCDPDSDWNSGHNHTIVLVKRREMMTPVLRFAFTVWQSRRELTAEDIARFQEQWQVEEYRQRSRAMQAAIEARNPPPPPPMQHTEESRHWVRSVFGTEV